MSTQSNLSVFLTAAALGLGFVPRAALAQPLGTSFTYQGELRTSGIPATGAHDLRFRLYDSMTGGAQVGNTLCFDNAPMTDGRFTVVLDFGAQFAGQQRFLEIEARADTGLDCANGAAFVLLSPRQPLTAAPNAVFALNAAAAANAVTATTATTATNATQLAGQAASFYQNAANLNTGTIPSARLSGSYSGALSLTNASNSFTGAGGGLTGLNASNLSTGTLPSGRLAGTYDGTLTLNNAGNWFVGTFTGTGAGLTNLHASNITSGTLSSSRLEVPLALSGSVAGGGVVHAGNTSGTGDAIGVVGASFSETGKGVYGYSFSPSGNTVGVEGRSLYSPTGTGVAGHAQATGGWFEAAASGGTGLFGVNLSTSGITYGIQGRVASSAGTAIRGEATSTTGSAHGVLGVTHSPSGIGVWGTSDAASGNGAGVYGSSDSPNGTAVDGRAWASTGTPVGVRGITSSAGGFGVYGVSTAATGNAVGIKGEVLPGNTTGTGVVGFASATGGWFEATSSSGNGLVGMASAAGGTPKGVWGIATSPNGLGVVGSSLGSSTYGVYAFGNLGASGIKSFRIDHPQDPENKYLLHYSAESPEVINFYSGMVTLDAEGGVIVELPAYFASINKSPRYSLTAVGAPMPMLHVADKISAESLAAGEKAGPADAVPLCSFRIAGGVPGGEVSWEVKAVRNDLRMRLHGAPVEFEKHGSEKGAYQHPDLYHQPADKGINYDATRRDVQPTQEPRRAKTPGE